ncbi:MAG: hypothetical protein QW622_03490 [Candidatus Pacearchaeota archaeon]
MPKLKEIEINYEDIADLVRQLSPKERIALLLSAIGVEKWRNIVYAYAEKLAKEKGFDKLTEDDLNHLLHE